VPMILAVAYVAVPYFLGVVTAEGYLEIADWWLLGALYCLFVARINLKDFRDRAGDAAYGKPTFLLRFGKPATCLLSAVGLLVGDILLGVALGGGAAYWLLQGFVAAIGAMLWLLYRAADHPREQLAIGLGAKLGNALLLALLGVLWLQQQSAEVMTQLILAGSFLAVGLASVYSIWRQPNLAANSYKG
jgi:4-hydroxybenzoate polyprenyltransferase